MNSYLKKNKPLLWLPLVLLPFVVLIFYILGGGENPRPTPSAEQTAATPRGANYELPDADHRLEIRDKTPQEESTAEVTESHDYKILGPADATGETDPDTLSGPGQADGLSEEHPEASLSVAQPATNPTEPAKLLEHIQARQEQFRRELEAGQTTGSQPKAATPAAEAPRKMTTPVAAGDHTDYAGQPFPLSGIEELDQVFRQNQHLARENDSLKKALYQATVFRQKVLTERNRLIAVGKGSPSPFRGAEPPGGLLKAEVWETTTALTGTRVKLRLLEDASVGGTHIPAGTFIYGSCQVSAERLRISVEQLWVNDRFVAVKLGAFDLDGLEGLYVPANATRKVAKEAGSSVNTSSLFGMTDNPLTYAGVQAADRTTQSLLRMVKVKRVTVKKNTLVYLINQPK